MAQIVGVFHTSHSQFCYSNPEAWSGTRAKRVLRADVPVDDADTNRRKFARVQASFATLKRKVAEARPDVMVIFGDDQLECFDFRNYPAFSVYVGETFAGSVVDRRQRQAHAHGQPLGRRDAALRPGEAGTGRDQQVNSINGRRP